ncbi:MAG: hypothetical protein WCI12_10670 [Actinomycetes bacterium]
MPPSHRPLDLGRSSSSTGSTKDLLHSLPARRRLELRGGETLHLLVLGSTWNDSICIDLASGALVRLRIPWPEDHPPDLAAFDVVEATLADSPEVDDLAQPEAATVKGLPRQIGTLRGRSVRKMLQRLQAPIDGPLLGFRGPSAPYWEFNGDRPSAALITASRGPQLLRRRDDGTTWVRFGWERDDVWLECADAHASRSLDAARRELLAGKDLATALGFKPHYLLTALNSPVEGHCYKICVAILPRG